MISINRWVENYQKSPAHFWGWLLFLLVLGLLGFWLPLALNISKEQKIDWNQLITGGELSTFAIVILIEAFITGHSLPKSKRMNFFLLGLTFVLCIFCCVFYCFSLTGIKTHTLKTLVCITSILSFILVVFLYQFKNIDTDEGADTFVQERNSEVEQDARPNPQAQNPIP